MRVYIGEQDEVAGRCRVWVAHEAPRPDISEVVAVLAEINTLADLRHDGTTSDEYDQQHAKTIARKNAIIDQLQAAERLPAPTELIHRGVHSTDGFEWGHCGAGPADLAYSVLLTEIGEPPTEAVYLRFRDDIIARFTPASFRLTADVVWEWVEANRLLVERELFEKIPSPADNGSTPALAVVDSDPPAPGPEMDEASGSAVVRACEQAWGDIKRHHPELPDVVVILGSGVERGRLVKLGHWWGGRWLADGQVRGEVLLAGEALHLPPSDVFEVLLHEAAHGLNAARRVPDTSRGGRYHNRRFALTANEVLLDAELMAPYGFAATKLTSAAKERYAPTIERLGEAMRIARQIERGVKVGVEAEGELGGGKEADGAEQGRDRNPAVASMCGCGRRMRMAPSVYEQGPVVCTLCGVAFRDGAERRAEPEHGDNVVDSTFVARRRAALEAELSSSADRVATLASVVDRARAQLASAVDAALGSTNPQLEPLLKRLQSIEELLEGAGALAETPSLAATETQREGVDDLLNADADRENDATVARWYETFGTPDEHPMPAGQVPDEQIDRARALLKADGTLSGPRLDVDGHEFMAGDRVVTTRDIPQLAVLGSTGDSRQGRQRRPRSCRSTSQLGVA